MNITLQKNGLEKTLKVGFSWSYFFLGAWLPLFKGKIGASFKHTIFSIFTLSIYYWIQCFGRWNKNIIIAHIEKGYEPLNDRDKEIIKSL